MLNLFRRTTPPSCIFCDIVSSSTGNSSQNVSGNDSATKEPSSSPPRVLAETSDVIAIPDKFPASKHHFLVMPKRHVDNAKCLSAGDLGLWAEMMRVGNELVDNQIHDEADR